MVALDQWLTSVFSDYYATTPTELKLPSCAGRNGLPNKSVSFFKHHVSAPLASMLRRQKWAVVTVPPAVHEDEAIQSTLRTEANVPIQSKPALAAFSLTAFQRRSRSAREYSAHIGTLAPALAGGFGGT